MSKLPNIGIVSLWRGNPGAEDGFGKFEDKGPEIHFDSFEDFFYLSDLMKSAQATSRQIGREDALAALDGYVKGLIFPASSKARMPPPIFSPMGSP